jgi:hypothetical protein
MRSTWSGKTTRSSTLRGRDFLPKESRIELLVDEDKRDKVVEALRTGRIDAGPIEKRSTYKKSRKTKKEKQTIKDLSDR